MGIKSPDPHIHRLLKFIHEIIIVENRSIPELCKQAGVSQRSLRRMWAGEADPYLNNVEALLNALGYTIKPTPLIEIDQLEKRRGVKTKGVLV